MKYCLVVDDSAVIRKVARRILEGLQFRIAEAEDGARAGIEAALVSLLEPGDRVLVPIFGRFGHLLREIAERCGAEVHVLEREWGTVFTPAEIEAALKDVKPKVLAVVHGDTSTTVAQPLDGLEHVQGVEGLGGEDGGGLVHQAGHSAHDHAW